MAGAPIDIMYDVMDENLMDSQGTRCGRVDDIVVEDTWERPPYVTGLLSGNGAKSRHLWKWLHRLSLGLHRMLGVPTPVEPTHIPWEQVERVEEDIVLKVTTEAAGLESLNRAVASRFIGHIPGAHKPCGKPKDQSSPSDKNNASEPGNSEDKQEAEDKSDAEDTSADTQGESAEKETRS